MADTFDRTYALDDIEIQRGGDGRTVTAYAAIFDTPTPIKDQHGEYHEVIARTAFTKTLVERSKRVGVFYNHGKNPLTGSPDSMLSVPIGTPLEIVADDRGLRTVTRYNRSPIAEQVLEAIRDGQIQGMSFRGRIFQSSPSGRVPRRAPGGALPTVTRTELGLIEYGPTPFPAYEGAGILAVRAVDIAATIGGMSHAERRELAELLRGHSSDLDEPDADENDVSATSHEAGTGESRTAHSGRLMIRRNAARVRLLMGDTYGKEATHRGH